MIRVSSLIFSIDMKKEERKKDDNQVVLNSIDGIIILKGDEARLYEELRPEHADVPSRDLERIINGLNSGDVRNEEALETINADDSIKKDLEKIVKNFELNHVEKAGTIMRLSTLSNLRNYKYGNKTF